MPLTTLAPGVVIDDAYPYGPETQHGPWIRSFDNETFTNLWTRTMWMIADQLPTVGSWGGEAVFLRAAPWQSEIDWTALTPTEVAKDYIPLVELSEPSVLDGPVLEYQETYAAVPPDRIEPVGYVDEEQQPAVISGADIIIRRSLPKTAFDHIDYWFAEDPRTIGLTEAGRFTTVRAQVYGSASTVSGGYVVAETSSVTRWRGNIFERRTRFVPARPTMPRVILTP